MSQQVMTANHHAPIVAAMMTAAMPPAGTGFRHRIHHAITQAYVRLYTRPGGWVTDWLRPSFANRIVDCTRPLNDRGDMVLLTLMPGVSIGVMRKSPTVEPVQLHGADSLMMTLTTL